MSGGAGTPAEYLGRRAARNSPIAENDRTTSAALRRPAPESTLCEGARHAAGGRFGATARPQRRSRPALCQGCKEEPRLFRCIEFLRRVQISARAASGGV